MKNIKWIVLAVALVAVMISATVIYDGYMKNNGGGIVPVESTPKQELEGDEPSESTPSDSSGDNTDADNGGEADDQENNDQENNDKEETKMTAPDFTVLDYEGNEVKLSDYVGKPTVLNFWATWCVYCKMEMPDFNKAYENYPDVQFLMVNATDGYYETVESAKKYVEGEGFSFTVLFDTKGDAERAYNVRGWPTTYFINANGDPVASASGTLSYETLQRGIAMITE